jgi:hypothetical protein
MCTDVAGVQQEANTMIYNTRNRAAGHRKVALSTDNPINRQTPIIALQCMVTICGTAFGALHTRLRGARQRTHQRKGMCTIILQSPNTCAVCRSCGSSAGGVEVAWTCCAVGR